jgi:hypothetical protein
MKQDFDDKPEAGPAPGQERPVVTIAKGRT